VAHCSGIRMHHFTQKHDRLLWRKSSSASRVTRLRPLPYTQFVTSIHLTRFSEPTP